MTSIRTPQLSSPEPHATQNDTDKICDQISDAILDAHLAIDPNAKVACETIAKTGLVMVFGEITSNASVNYNDIIRDTIKSIGE